jgi:hypothetical protein
MPPDIPSPDPTRRRDHAPHLEDNPAALDTYVASKTAERDRQQFDMAAWDKSAALFTSQHPFAGPAVAALRAQLATPPASSLSPDAALMLSIGAQESASDRQIEGLRQAEATLPLRGPSGFRVGVDNPLHGREQGRDVRRES